MAGAMRRMGIYLGLVEDDDARGYGRYDSRQSEPATVTGATAGTPRTTTTTATPTGTTPRTVRQTAVEESGRPRARAAHGAPRPGRPAARPGAGRRLGRSGGSAGVAGRAMGSGPVGAPPEAGGARADGRRRPEPAPRRPAPQPYRITTLHPRTYNEARTIGERFRDGMPVIMNLTEMDDADAKRLVDFAAGLTFGLRGSIERVTAKVFLLSPQNVDVTAEDKARIREGGFFNQS